MLATSPPLLRRVCRVLRAPLEELHGPGKTDAKQRLCFERACKAGLPPSLSWPLLPWLWPCAGTWCEVARARMLSLLGVFLFLLQLSTRLFLLRIFRLFLAALGLVGRRMRLGRRIGRIRTVPPRLWQLWLLLFLALLFWPGQRLLAAFSSPGPPFWLPFGLVSLRGKRPCRSSSRPHAISTTHRSMQHKERCLVLGGLPVKPAVDEVPEGFKGFRV